MVEDGNGNQSEGSDRAPAAAESSDSPTESVPSTSGSRLLSIKEIVRSVQAHRSDTFLVQQLREQILFEELEIIRKEANGRFAGIYVMPSFQSMLEWHGIICLRTGLYQHGTYKFIVRIPAKYPSEAPRISFISHCIPFHPLVDSKSGHVNFQFFLTQGSNGNGQWNIQRHRMHTMLGWLKSAFYPSSLPAAADMLAIPDLPGDPAVTQFQVFNPQVALPGGVLPAAAATAAAAAAAAAGKDAGRAGEALTVLTNNWRWWTQHRAAVKKVEEGLGIKLYAVTHTQLQHVLQECSDKQRRTYGGEATQLWQALNTSNINFRRHVEASVDASQGKLKHNFPDFAIRVRNDVEQLMGYVTNQAPQGGQGGGSGGGGGDGEGEGELSPSAAADPPQSPVTEG